MSQETWLFGVIGASVVVFVALKAAGKFDAWVHKRQMDKIHEDLMRRLQDHDLPTSSEVTS